MAHSLQAQASTELALAPCDQPELLEARVRAHFGSAAPIRWAASTSHAIRSALRGEAVAIVPEPLPEGEGELRVFEELPFRDVARAAGCTENAAKVNFHHAVKRIKEWLAGKP